MPDAPARDTSHPNGPRTFANVLRDGVAMPHPVLERLAAAEHGRHPELSDLRAALGIDLSIEGWSTAARAAWPGPATPADEDCARIIDAMHAAITSPRRIAVAITPDGPRASRQQGEIVIRDEERLVLLVFAANDTGEGARFSAEAHGEGMGGYIEPHRAGSGLFDAGAMHPGSYLLPVMVVAGGHAATIDLPIDCRPSGILRARILDDETGEPIAARVYLDDDAGPAWPAAATVRRDVYGDAFFHADGAFEARCSGAARLRVMRGIEYEAFEQEVKVPADRETEVVVRLRRWSHMAADGWYSGDVHVHLHYGGDTLLSPAGASLAQRGEDVNFMNMMVANQGSGWVHDADLFTGAPHELSDETHILRWGEEYRNDFYGHMCMYGINELVPPIYSGVRDSEHAHDLPANADAARHCHGVGGTLSYAHPLFRSADLDVIFDPQRRRSVEAKELPIDAALGLIDALDVMSYPSHNLAVADLWYRLLNCGHRLAATAGTDTFMNTSDDGEFSNPPAGVRAYARIAPTDAAQPSPPARVPDAHAFTTESWCAAVRAGRTFVTNAPMLSLEVTPISGSQPPPVVPPYTIGDDISAAPGDVIRIEAAAGSAAPMERIEIIVNGEIVATAPATDAGAAAAVTHDLAVAGPCWIAARAIGPKSRLVLDPGESNAGPPGDVYAHTSPVYVSVAGARQASPADARYFVEWIDRLIAQVERSGRYPSEAERDGIVAIFRQAQDYYRVMIS
jgi:hypothetical protein